MLRDVTKKLANHVVVREVPRAQARARLVTAPNPLPLWILGTIWLARNLPEVNAVVVSVVALTLLPIAYAAKISSSDQTGAVLG